VTLDDATRAKIRKAMEATALEFVMSDLAMEIADQSIAGVTVNDATEVCERLMNEAVAAEREEWRVTYERAILRAEAAERNLMPKVWRERIQELETARDALAAKCFANASLIDALEAARDALAAALKGLLSHGSCYGHSKTEHNQAVDVLDAYAPRRRRSHE
jgi:hypothetical protein